MSDRVREVVDAVDDTGVQYLRSVCERAGVDVEEAGVRTPDVILMLALVGAPAAISFVLERWHDRLRGGQIIDLRPDAVQVARRDRELVYGLVIVRAVDGSATIRVHEPSNQTLELVQAVIDALGGLVGSGIGAARAKVTEVVGDKAAVTAGEPDAADPDAVGS